MSKQEEKEWKRKQILIIHHLLCHNSIFMRWVLLSGTHMGELSTGARLEGGSAGIQS